MNEYVTRGHKWTVLGAQKTKMFWFSWIYICLRQPRADFTVTYKVWHHTNFLSRLSFFFFFFALTYHSEKCHRLCIDPLPINLAFTTLKTIKVALQDKDSKSAIAQLKQEVALFSLVTILRLKWNN